MNHLVGKRLNVRVPEGRDDNARRNHKLIEFAGVCDYIGPNKVLGYELMVVIGRMPVQLTHINQIIKVSE